MRLVRVYVDQINDKCRCECKELIDNSEFDKGFIQNPSNCKCECDKSCSIGEYLDYSNCKCRKNLLDPLVEECTENIDEKTLVNTTVEKNHSRGTSYDVYKMLFGIFFKFFIINSGIIIYFVYLKYVNRIKYNLPY